MLKRRSLSTEDGGEHSVFFETFPSSEIMLRLTFHHCSRCSSGRQQHLSSSVFRVSDDDLRAFLFFEACFSTFCTADVVADDQSS